METPQSFDELAASVELERRLQGAPDDFPLTRREAALFIRKSLRTLDYYLAFTRRGRRVNKTHRGKGVSGKVIIMSARLSLPFTKIGGDLYFALGDLRKFRNKEKIAA